MIEDRQTVGAANFQRSRRKRSSGEELRGVIRAMRKLTLELDQLRSGGQSATDLKAKEQALELLHWRLARVARQTATDELGNAA
jgi:hypothetical protein